MKCPKCKGQVNRVEGLSTEPEGIRNDCWCEECKIMFTCTKAMFVKRLKLEASYAPKLKELVVHELEYLLERIRQHS